MESYIKMHKIFEKEAVMDGLIGASKELVIMTLGKPKRITKTRWYILPEAVFGAYIKENFICSFIRNG